MHSIVSTSIRRVRTRVRVASLTSGQECRFRRQGRDAACLRARGSAQTPEHRCLRNRFHGSPSTHLSISIGFVIRRLHQCTTTQVCWTPERIELSQIWPAGHSEWPSREEASVRESKAERGPQDISAHMPPNEEQLRARAAELTELSRHLIQVAEEEKAELARELHDTFGSNLTAINMDLNWIAKRLPPDRPELQDRLQRALRMLRETVAIKQDVIDRLRPSQLDTLGLAVALRAQCRELTTRTGIPCEVDALEEFEGLDRTWSIALFRIAQEALSNVEKHADAASVAVELVREGRGMRLRIRDDGIGLGHDASHAPDSHGLVGMRERVEALGGILQVTTTGGRGTLVDAFIPGEQQ
jgi:signal transduction histidine kinase